ncbi:MAG: long-chain fatty acid--CoA ligase, partial [Kurthia sp.]|nr:long-chain fatty acid--CoA ligase [Kurthia sp.]
CAYITLKEEIHPERLKMYCEGHLVEYKCPTEIRIVEQLPKNSTGKVLKRQLAEEELR